jgi:AbrB family looped-hinge helix DNA binding protein
MRVRRLAMATVTRKGQVTLPREVRQALGIESGAEVDFDIQSDGVLIRKKVAREAFEHWRGYLQTRGIKMTTDELMAQIRGE